MTAYIEAGPSAERDAEQPEGPIPQHRLRLTALREAKLLELLLTPKLAENVKITDMTKQRCNNLTFKPDRVI
jgi:hypothetical protein